MLAQMGKFEWEVYWSPKHPNWLRRTGALQDRLAGIQRALEMHGWKLIQHEATWDTQHLPPLGGPRVSRRVTSRVDSDDIVHNEFALIVQKYARQTGEDQFICFDDGYMMEEGLAYPKTERSNAFLSYVEKGIKPKGVYHKGHLKAKPIKHISERPMWIQVSHGGNLCNTIARNKENERVLIGEPVPQSTVRNDFTWK